MEQSTTISDNISKAHAGWIRRSFIILGVKSQDPHFLITALETQRHLILQPCKANVSSERQARCLSAHNSLYSPNQVSPSHPPSRSLPFRFVFFLYKTKQSKAKHARRFISTFYIRFILNLILLCIWMFRLYVCLAYLVPKEAGRGLWISWNWSCRWLWAAWHGC